MPMKWLNWDLNLGLPLPNFVSISPYDTAASPLHFTENDKILGQVSHEASRVWNLHNSHMTPENHMATIALWKTAGFTEGQKRTQEKDSKVFSNSQCLGSEPGKEHMCWEAKKRKCVRVLSVPRSHRMSKYTSVFLPWLRAHGVRDSEEMSRGHYAQTLSLSAQQG